MFIFSSVTINKLFFTNGNNNRKLPETPDPIGISTNAVKIIITNTLILSIVHHFDAPFHQHPCAGDAAAMFGR